MKAIHDKFTTNKTTEQLSSSSCEPGPGTRTKTGNVLIDSEELRFTTAGEWFYLNPSVLRVAGRVASITFSLVSNVAPNTVFFGSAVNNAVKVTDFNYTGVQFTSASSITARVGGGASTSFVFFGSIVIGRKYTLYQVYRTSGQFLLLKDHVTGEIALRHVDSVDNTGYLYIGVGMGSNSSFKVYKIYYEQNHFMIGSSVSDTFDRADGILGTTDGLAQADINSGSGFEWIEQVGSFNISNSAARAATLTNGTAIATVEDIAPDQIILCKTTQSSGRVGIIIRYVDANNYIAAYYDGTNAKLEKVINGNATQVGVSITSNSKIDVMLKVLIKDTEIMMYYGDYGMSTTGLYTIDDLIFSLATKFGVYSTSTENTIKNFVAYNIYGYGDLQAPREITNVTMRD